MANIQTTKDRLLAFLKEEGLSQGKFERACGLSNGYVNNLKRSVSTEKLELISRAYPALNIQWLMTGEGEMFVERFNLAKVMPKSDRSGYEVPLIPVHAFAGSITESLEDAVFADECEKIISPVSSAQWAMAISGDSMEPQFADGSIVFIARINDVAFIPWGHPMILDTENGVLLKNLYPTEDDEYVEARSNNPKYPAFRIPKSSIRGIYRVINVSKFFVTM